MSFYLRKLTDDTIMVIYDNTIQLDKDSNADFWTWNSSFDNSLLVANWNILVISSDNWLDVSLWDIAIY